MKSSLKKTLSLFIALVIAVSSFAVSLVVFGDDSVEINEANFPDTVWRNVIKLMYDEDNDNVLSAQEIENATQEPMIVSGMIEEYEAATGRTNCEINDLTGIEYFTSLKKLRCNYIGNLSSLDISKLTELTTLDCSGNDISYLDLSNNKKLTELHCSSNDAIQSLDLTANTALKTLNCFANANMRSLNVRGLSALDTLRCHQCMLTSLDLSSNTALRIINCSYNNLTSLDLSNNTALTSVSEYTIGNQTTSASAIYSDNAFTVYLSIDTPSRVVSTSVDTEEGLGYVNGKFFTDSFDKIADGIDYEYSTGLESAANMTVHVDVNRDFYQVNFYTSEDLSEKIGSSYATANTAAQAPEISVEAPQCKAFDCWSEDISRVTSDMDVYIIWKDAHNYQLVNFDSDNMATIKCLTCDETRVVKFIDVVNTGEGDSNYEPCLDLTGDNFINVKDYAKIIKQFG